MERIKTLIIQNFESIFPLFVCTAGSLFLLMIRLKISHTFFMLFLVWNLFLAAIPYIISFYVAQTTTIKKWQLTVLFIVWLLFLPNAPYIITDFIHLTHLEANMKLFDALLIAAFATTGVLFYTSSVRTMRKQIQRQLSTKWTNLLFFCVPFLSGFGIYLGRFLRWNSWDIIQNPWKLITDISTIIVNPIANKGAWITTLVFGCSLLLITKVVSKKNKENP